MSAEQLIHAVAEQALSDAPQLLERWFPAGRRHGSEFVVGDLDGNPGESCKINVETGAWADFATGQRGGDLVDLVAACRGQRMIDAARELAPHVGVEVERYLDRTNGSAKGSGKTSWTPIHPVPADAPTPEFRHHKHGRPSATWTYRDASGAVIGYVCRFDRADGEKEIIPRSYCHDGAGRSAWRWKSFAKPRPLYRLDALAAAPGQQAILTEGEKAADAAQRLLPSGIATTWPGGANADGTPDFTPLAGRKVVLWPDADAEGQRAMERVAARLAAHNCQVRVVDTTELPEKFDAADFDSQEHGEPAAFLRARLYAPDVSTTSTPGAPAEPEPAAEQGAETPLPVLDFSDDEIAERFTHRYTDELRHVAAWGRWLRYDGQVWHFDETHEVFDLARGVCRDIAAMAEKGNRKRSLASAKTVAAVERLAKADRRHAATVEQWDADPNLLNTPSGVVDLRTGEVRPHRRDDHMTKITAVGPSDGDCPRWHQFLDTVTAGDAELQRYLKRVVGYALTGSTREHALFFVHGRGGNGKSVFLNTVSQVLGEYHRTAPMDTFTAAHGERHPTELAQLRGARMVTAVETEEGRRWAESRIKALTGGDPISARFMRQDFFTFTPQFKLVVAGNHKPQLRNVDDAMRRRIHLIPFTVRIPEDQRDDDLPEKLRAEWPAILGWAIEGAVEWGMMGLQPPETVRAATQTYLEEEDALSQWISERCHVDANASAPLSELFASWKAWADAASEFIGSQKRFSQSLESKGYQRTRLHGGKTGFYGLRPTPIEPEQPTW